LKFFVCIAQARSVLVLKDDEDKILQLDPYKIAALAGDHGDRVQFSEFIQKNIQLDYYRTGLLHRYQQHKDTHFTLCVYLCVCVTIKKKRKNRKILILRF
jgi:20S proteasome alpha/beta subunit